MAAKSKKPAVWNKSPWSDAAQLDAVIHPDAAPEPAAGQLPHEWYATLRDAGRLFDAVTFLGHALPRYECVAWAARALLEMDAADRHDPLMVAALRWIDAPGDALRRAAGELAETTRRGSPAKLLAQAVAMSGGSLAPEDLPPVLPPPEVCARLATAAVLSGAQGCANPAAALGWALDLGESFATEQ